MPKLQNPPQGGEKRLCLTLFCTMMLSVISAVAIIYSIVIVYIPAMKELDSTLEGPKMCTTLATEGNLTNTDACGGEKAWSSCEEWCLSMVRRYIHEFAGPLSLCAYVISVFERVQSRLRGCAQPRLRDRLEGLRSDATQ